MGKLQWGILGLDLNATEYIQHLSRHNGVYAASDPDKERLQAFCQKYSILKAYDYGTLLEDPAIDIIYISSYGNLHYQQIMDCLSHGKHVFCEKNMLRFPEQLKSAHELAARNNLFFGEAMTIFYMPLYKKIRQMINNGVIGKLKMIRADFGSKKLESEPHFFSRELFGGAMMDIGIYALSFVLLFMPDSPIHYIGIQGESASEVDEQWSILLKNEQQNLANVNLSFRAKLPKRALIAGDSAYFQIYDFNRADMAELVYPDGKTLRISEGSMAQAVTTAIHDVEHAILSGNYTCARLDITMKAIDIMNELLNKNEQKGYNK